jgi:hypothetical protein
MGKSTISMAIFNSYVKLPEGNSWLVIVRNCAGYWTLLQPRDTGNLSTNKYNGTMGEMGMFIGSVMSSIYEYWLDKIDMISQDLEYPLGIKSGNWKSPN